MLRSIESSVASFSKIFFKNTKLTNYSGNRLIRSFSKYGMNKSSSELMHKNFRTFLVDELTLDNFQAPDDEKWDEKNQQFSKIQDNF